MMMTNAMKVLNCLVVVTLIQWGGARGASVADDLPANAWTTVDTGIAVGTSAGLVYLPEQKGMLQLAPGQNSIFGLNDRKWATTAPAIAKGQPCQWYTSWAKGHPIIGGYNVGFWAAHQMCYLPDEKRVLCYWGGSTFKYDPVANACENMDIALSKAPPDVMMGSMVWDAAGKRAILFGGGYIRAHTTNPYGDNTTPPADAWQPENWDRRGTWAYDPSENTWRKLETASKDVYAANVRLVECGKELRALWGAARGIAFEYGDRVSQKKPAELAGLVEKFAAEMAAFAKANRGKGGSEYEKRRFAEAVDLIEKDVAAKLAEASAALKAEDGWKAFRALDEAEKTLIAAQEAVTYAPPPRYYGRLTLDSANKALVLFGGFRGDKALADTWLFHLGTDRWERCVVEKHPPVTGSGMVAMDYDAANKVVVLAHQDGSLWTFDAGKRQWRQWKMDGVFGNKGKGATWMSLEYSPETAAHVGVVTEPNRESPANPRLTQLIRLDMKTAKEVEAAAGAPDETWCSDKVSVSWSFLPKTQAEYRERVAAHKKFLAAMPDNTWTELKLPYSAWGRAYGSFCHDWDRDEIYLYGGGHSAYQGNELSQYDLAGNMWMESWNPEFPPSPHGSPAGDCWGPTFNVSVKPSNHAYHLCAYWGAAGKLACAFRPYDPVILYDPDRMRYADEKVAATDKRTLGGQLVAMGGVPELYGVNHWGATIWKADAKGLCKTWVASGPFRGPEEFGAISDRVKPVFDTKRNRILVYGAYNDKTRKTANATWSYGVKSGQWEKIESKMEPEGTVAPVPVWWNYAYSTKDDCLLLADAGGTWVYDCEKNVWKKLDCKPCGTQAGVIYSPRQNLFYLLDGNGYAPQRVFVFRYRP
ncbi:MAG: kelch repeat-containing protein [Phycisphaerae bacterium]|nr:kelch repeat-containing protein [Phycisphaerae bacterium]